MHLSLIGWGRRALERGQRSSFVFLFPPSAPQGATGGRGRSHKGKDDRVVVSADALRRPQPPVDAHPGNDAGEAEERADGARAYTSTLPPGRYPSSGVAAKPP